MWVNMLIIKGYVSISMRIIELNVVLYRMFAIHNMIVLEIF